MPKVAYMLCMEIRDELEHLASDLDGGSFLDKLSRANMESWERAKYQEYWKFTSGDLLTEIGSQKGRCNEILDDLKRTHKF